MIAVSASIAILLHQQVEGTDDEARKKMKRDIWNLIEPMMREASASGMKIEAYVEQLTSQER